MLASIAQFRNQGAPVSSEQLGTVTNSFGAVPPKPYLTFALNVLLS